MVNIQYRTDQFGTRQRYDADTGQMVNEETRTISGAPASGYSGYLVDPRAPSAFGGNVNIDYGSAFGASRRPVTGNEEWVDPRVTVAELQLEAKRTPSVETAIPSAQTSALNWAKYNLDRQKNIADYNLAVGNQNLSAQEQERNYDLAQERLAEEQRQADMSLGGKQETQETSGGTATFGTESTRSTTTGTLAPTEATVKAVTDEFRSGIESVLAKEADPTKGWATIQTVLTSAIDTIRGRPEYEMVSKAIERELDPATIEAERTKLTVASQLGLSGREQAELASYKNAAIPAADRRALVATTREKYDNQRLQIPSLTNETMKDRVASALSAGVQYALGTAGTEAELYGRGLSLLESVGARQGQLEATMRTALMEAGLTPTRGEIVSTSEAARAAISPTWETGTSTTSPLNFREAATPTAIPSAFGGATSPSGASMFPQESSGGFATTGASALQLGQRNIVTAGEPDYSFLGNRSRVRAPKASPRVGMFF